MSQHTTRRIAIALIASLTALGGGNAAMKPNMKPNMKPSMEHKH